MNLLGVQSPSIFHMPFLQISIVPSMPFLHKHGDKKKALPSSPQLVDHGRSCFFKDYTRYTHAHEVPHAEHMERWRSLALARQRRAVLCLSVHGSASKVNGSGCDTQVVSCHRYLVVFHPFVEQLTVFHTSGLVLALSSIL